MIFIRFGSSDLVCSIFVAMVPALDWLSHNALSLNLNTVRQFLLGNWTDIGIYNAPAYLNFVAAAMGLNGASIHDKSQVAAWAMSHADILRSISISSVFFRRSNLHWKWPKNSMVKSICDQYNVQTPSFLVQHDKYSLPILLPVLVIVYLLVI